MVGGGGVTREPWLAAVDAAADRDDAPGARGPENKRALQCDSRGGWGDRDRNIKSVEHGTNVTAVGVEGAGDRRTTRSSARPTAAWFAPAPRRRARDGSAPAPAQALGAGPKGPPAGQGAASLARAGSESPSITRSWSCA